VSVRSGSARSMPGMMETILNLGLNDKSVAGLARATQNERFALRCVQAIRADVFQRGDRLAKEEFEARLRAMKKRLGSERRYAK
jgi:pyruvate,orthophosphate dikinase